MAMTEDTEWFPDVRQDHVGAETLRRLKEGDEFIKLYLRAKERAEEYEEPSEEEDTIREQIRESVEDDDSDDLYTMLGKTGPAKRGIGTVDDEIHDDEGAGAEPHEN